MIEVRGTQAAPEADPGARYAFDKEEKRSRTPWVVGIALVGLAAYLKNIFPGWAKLQDDEWQADPHKEAPAPAPTMAETAAPAQDKLDPTPTGTVADPAPVGSGGQIVSINPPAQFTFVPSPEIDPMRLVIPESELQSAFKMPVFVLAANDNATVRAGGGALPSPFDSPPVPNSPPAGESPTEAGDLPASDDGPADGSAPVDPSSTPGLGDPDEDGDGSVPGQDNRAPRVSGPVYLGNVYGCTAALIMLDALLANASDADDDVLTIQSISSSSGSIELAAAGWWFTASALGPVVLEYEISDGTLGVTQTAYFNVLPNLPLIGTHGDDLLVGTECADQIDSQGGDDNIDARGGNDTIEAGCGDDHILGGSGDDFIRGGDGDDVIFGGSGNDQISGGNGDDRLFGDGGADIMFGDAGHDLIYGGAGDDMLLGGSGKDTILGEAGDDTLLGEADDDELSGGAGNDHLRGDAGDDLLLGQAGDDLLSGGEGDDVLAGGDGNDQLLGDAGSDTLDGGEGDDRLDGSSGNDLLAGQAGDDLLSGGEGDDELAGGGGNDQLLGDAGSDVLDGGEGNDRLDGGSGADLLVGQAGDDLLSGGEGDDELVGGEGDDQLIGGAGSDDLDGGDGNDRLEGGAGNDLLEGNRGNDVLIDGPGCDQVDGGAGDDIVIAALDCVDDSYEGGEGADTIDYSRATSAIVVDLAAQTASGVEIGSDSISGFESVIGGIGDDHFIVGSAAVALRGRDGNDVFEFSASSGGDAASCVVHEILDFMVGDRIRIDRYDLFDEVLDAVEDRFEDIYGEDGDEDELPIRIRHQETDMRRATIVEADFDKDEKYELSIEITGHHLLMIVEHV